MAKKKSKKAAKKARKTARKASTRSTAGSALTKTSKAKPYPRKGSVPKVKRISVGEHATNKLLVLAASYFGSEPAAVAWFNYPKDRLNGVSPREACKTSDGREEVRSWLEEIADGAFS